MCQIAITSSIVKMAIMITKEAKMICENNMISFLFMRSAYAPPIKVRSREGAALAAPTNPKNIVESLI